MTSLTEDIDTLTDGYLAALRSNSDEIARLAGALRQTEAERDSIQEHKRAADNHILRLESKLMDLEEQRNAARDVSTALAAQATATEQLARSEAGRDAAVSELVEARLELANAEACRAEAERQMNAALDKNDADHAHAERLALELGYAVETCDALMLALRNAVKNHCQSHNI